MHISGGFSSMFAENVGYKFTPTLLTGLTVDRKKKGIRLVLLTFDAWPIMVADVVVGRDRVQWTMRI